MYEYIEPTVNEADKTITVANMPSMTRFNPEAAKEYPDIEFYVHRIPDTTKFDAMLVEWKDGTRLFLDLDAVTAFLLMGSMLGAPALLAAMKLRGNELQGVYKVV